MPGPSPGGYCGAKPGVSCIVSRKLAGTNQQALALYPAQNGVCGNQLENQLTARKKQRQFVLEWLWIRSPNRNTPRWDLSGAMGLVRALANADGFGKARQSPDLLLCGLNHLDLETIEWLETYLKGLDDPGDCFYDGSLTGRATSILETERGVSTTTRELIVLLAHKS